MNGSIEKQTAEYFAKQRNAVSVALRDGAAFVVAEGVGNCVGYTYDSDANGFADVAKALLVAKEDINAVTVTSLPFTRAMADAGVSIPAVLDDQAQIVGPSCKVAAFTADSVTKALKGGRNAALIAGVGAVSVGRTTDEAETTSLVLEKAARAYIEGSIVGKPKAINKFDALLMHIIYKMKYSKKDQQAKMEELK